MKPGAGRQGIWVMASDRANRGDDGRTAAIVVVLAVHLGVVAALTCLPRHVAVTPPLPTMTAREIAVPVVAAAAPPPPPDLRAVRQLTPPAVETDDAAAALPLPCAVAAEIAAGLVADPAAIVALGPVAALPAPAIMAWDGHWSMSAAGQALRHAATSALRAARPDCLDEVLAGPRLIAVPVAGTSVAVAVGSGTWHWRDLLTSDQSLDETSDKVPGADEKNNSP